MSEPIWIDANALRLLHRETLAEFGGLSGMRDEGLFLSALARPRNLFVYEEVTNISRLAAAYAYGLARNHPRQSLELNSRACGAVHSAPFSDGNKRAAFLAIGMFLAINGFLLKVEPTEAVNTMLALAAGDLAELELTKWIEKFIVKA